MATEKGLKKKDLKVFVCDLGFSAVKWAFDEQVGRFFSATALIKGKRVYGDEAMFSPTPSYLLTCENLVDRYPEMCQQAIREADCSESLENIHMVVGLPLEFFETQQDRPAGGEIGVIRTSLMKEGFGEVTVLPQGLGGVVFWSGQNPDHAGNILALDVGFSTIIMSLYAPESGKIIYSSTKFNHGVKRLGNEYLAPKIASFAPSRTLTPPSLCMIMERGVLSYGMNKQDVTPQLNEAVGEYVKQTLEDVVSELKANVGEAMNFDTLLFFGGGARHIDGRVENGDNPCNIVVMEEPEMANARGFKVIVEGQRV